LRGGWGRGRVWTASEVTRLLDSEVVSSTGCSGWVGSPPHLNVDGLPPGKPSTTVSEMGSWFNVAPVELNVLLTTRNGGSRNLLAGSSRTAVTT